MSIFQKIVRFLLYFVFGISVIIMGIFYFGEKLVNESAYESKLAKIEAQQEAAYPQIQTEAVTKSAVEEGDTEIARPVPPAAPSKQPVSIKSVKFSFFEKLVYYKTDVAIIWGYILLGITLLLALIFPLIFMFTSFRNLIRTLGLLVAAAVLVGIAYLLSSGTPIPIPGYEGTDNSDPAVLKLIDTGIFLTYFLVGLALLSILYSEVVKAFK